ANPPAIPRVALSAVVDLRMPDSLLLLNLQIAGPPVFAAKATFGCAVSKLANPLGQKVGHAGQRFADANAPVGSRMVVIVRVNLLNPILGGIAVHGAGRGPGIIER